MPRSGFWIILFALTAFASLSPVRAEPAPDEPAKPPAPAAPAPTPEPIPFEYQPYRVLVSVAFANAPGLDPQIRQSVLLDIPRLSERMLGEMWTVAVEDNAWLVPVSSENLQRLKDTDLPEAWRGEQRDKSFLVTIEQIGGQYQISGREWDSIGRFLGSAKTHTVIQRREISNVLFRLVHDLFRPLLTIDQVADGAAKMTVKAGALTPADPAFAQLRKDQFWQPFLRYRNTKNEVDKLEVIPWTMLQVSDINKERPAHGQAKIVTGFRSPLPARKRSRVDLFARAVQADNSVTEFRLVSKRDPSRPLVGVVVEVKPAKDAPTRQRLLTDRSGSIRVTPRADEPIVWLFVRSGEKKLALLPVVPGMEPFLTAELPDDSIRLRVEGELSILESNLTDTVAQRAVLMARIRKFATAGDWKSTRELQSELRLLPISTVYLQELAAIRLPSVQAAQADKDKSTVASIERACDKTSKLIQKFLDEDKLKTFEDEIRELERESDKAPPK